MFAILAKVRLMTAVVVLGMSPRVGSAPQRDEGPGHASFDPQSAEVQVWAIRATTKNSEISPELRSMADKLKKQFKYTGFRLERKAREEVSVGKTLTSRLIDDYRANVVLEGRDGQRVTLNVQISQGKDNKPRVSATITLAEGRFQLLGGLSLEGGDALIVAVAAR